MQRKPLTISKEAPSRRSMDYAFLREEGLKYIQKTAGNTWTDYNTHDPGVTILEALCYAITDLGYRTSYDVKDIIASDPDDPHRQQIANFFSAAEILPGAPVTISDYRKLIIDVELHDPATPACNYAGVKNAWVEMAKKPELDIYVDRRTSTLVYEAAVAGQQPIDIRGLYNVLLEFSKCDAFGDLNDNKITKDLSLQEHVADRELEGLRIRVDVQFPRWDNDSVNWNSDSSIKESIIDIGIKFINLGENYTINASLTPGKEIMLSGTRAGVSGLQPIDGLNDITLQVNKFMFDGAESLLAAYKRKIEKIHEIINEVKATLHANRNLCEDFMKFSALRIEEILVCADIELAFDADVERVQAQIYHDIGRFLSPTVYFYSLDEMLNDCRGSHQYQIVSVNTDKGVVTVNARLDEEVESADVITVSGSDANSRQYTVLSWRTNKDNEAYTDIFVRERIASDILENDEKLFIGEVDKFKCTPVEKIFEGPRLRHGFIKDDELEKADRVKVIHTSDLIRIIMAVPGVLAVKNIQIANMPQDNEDGSIISKSVKWCLQLAFDQNYVPRLNTNNSRITFYKDQLPFKARQVETDRIMQELEARERPQKKNKFPLNDIAIPRGEYKALDEYYSIQNEFPLVYGIGEDGLPPVSKGKPDEAQARQLKGFLMVFDQLLANYLAQLANAKDLFSMNPTKDKFGDYIIGKTYYTQPLFEIVPRADDLYIDKRGHAVALDAIAEDAELFGERRNRFLDHLMARFAEQFTDYALMTYRLSGPKAPLELIEDKLSFLNAYPAISAQRGSGFNYKKSGGIWSIRNASGLAKRASMLLGIPPRKASSLEFSPRFKFTGNVPNISIAMENDAHEIVLESTASYVSVDDAREALEQIIVAGLFRANYIVTRYDATHYLFELADDKTVIARSAKTDFTSADSGGDADRAIGDVMQLLTTEFFENPESNRNNLSCPLLNYFKYSLSTDMMVNPPAYTISYELYKTPFKFIPVDKILTGSYTGHGDEKGETSVLVADAPSKKIIVAGNISTYLLAGDFVVIKNSGENDGIYTVSTFGLDGANTAITVNESIAGNAAPHGTLLYNRITNDELMRRAENKVQEWLWNVVAAGSRRKNYLFYPAVEPFTSPYKFMLMGLGGAVLGESVAFDFNESIASEISNTTSGKINVTGSSYNDGQYDVVSATARGPYIDVVVSPPPFRTVADGSLSFTESLPLRGVSVADRVFIINGNFSNRIFEGDNISITGSESNDASYIVLKVSFAGTETSVTVKEPIPSDAVNGSLIYTRSYSIEKASGNAFTLKGAGDEKAVNEMIEFLNSSFLDHEGMHVLEHVLLRPKTNELLFVDADENTLREALTGYGTLTFRRKHPLRSADSGSHTFTLEGDLTSDLSVGMHIYVSDFVLLNGRYTIRSLTVAGTHTKIGVDERFHADVLEALPSGVVSYSISKSILAVDSANQVLTISGNISSSVGEGDIVAITGSQDGVIDGRYIISEAEDVGGDTELLISKVERHVADRLLNINLDENCDCALEDPYTCIAHVILPYWPGRFINTDFRKFLEKTLRLEAPAHVFLNICWISCAHMDEFEKKYKAWLLENAKPATEKTALSWALKELIESLEQLRNVYPVGTLHDCDEDDNLENSIILNNSALGEF